MKSITIVHLIMGAIIVSLLLLIVLDTHSSNDYIKTLLDDKTRELEACNYERLLYLNKLMYNETHDFHSDTVIVLDRDSIANQQHKQPR